MMMHSLASAAPLRSAPHRAAHRPVQCGARVVACPSTCTLPCRGSGAFHVASARRTRSTRRQPTTACASWPRALASHFSVAFDGHARLALPQGSLPAEPTAPLSHILWAWLGCFTSCAALGLIDNALAAHAPHVPFLLGSFGTISVLYFGVGLRAPLLRVWNVVAGHVFAAAFALAALQYIQPLWLARATALATTVAVMLWTGCVHPPGGALVLILLDSARFQTLGLWYLVYPGVAGSMLLMVFGRATDELKKRYVFTWEDVVARFSAPQTAVKAS